MRERDGRERGNDGINRYGNENMDLAARAKGNLHLLD